MANSKLDYITLQRTYHPDVRAFLLEAEELLITEFVIKVSKLVFTFLVNQLK